MAAQAGDWLADKNIQERIGLSGRGVEHVDWREGRAVHPAVRRDPASVGMRRSSAQLRGEGVAVLSRERLLGLLQRHAGLGEIKHAAESVIERRGQVVGELSL